MPKFSAIYIYIYVYIYAIYMYIYICMYANCGEWQCVTKICNITV
jgi:hypothetical protein